MRRLIPHRSSADVGLSLDAEARILDGLRDLGRIGNSGVVKNLAMASSEGNARRFDTGVLRQEGLDGVGATFAVHAVDLKPN